MRHLEILAHNGRYAGLHMTLAYTAVRARIILIPALQLQKQLYHYYYRLARYTRQYSSTHVLRPANSLKIGKSENSIHIHLT
jgi:hypothetical protein